ncbi:hypothetical protein DMUE_0341 [Dictyocoela muelleri]|nr:hypothetical protein DMUE_0341 [Dictyocoela muelleri]
MKSYDYNSNNKSRDNEYMVNARIKEISKKDNIKRPKFCKYHNTNSHDLSECRAFKKNKNYKANKNNEQTEKTYALNEPKCNPKTIEIPIEINEKKIDGLVDTGSVENYISESAVKVMDVKTNNLHRKKMTEVGDVVEIEKESDLKFRLLNDINNYYFSKFYVMPNPNKQNILGMRFPFENDAVINLRERFINLDGGDYKLNIVNRISNLSEDELIQKSKTFTLSELGLKIEKLITNFKNENPKFGYISNINHSIDLFYDFKTIKKKIQFPSDYKRRLQNISKHFLKIK